MLNKITYRLRSMKLRKRLIIMFLTLSIAPIIVVGSVSVSIASNEVERRYVNDVAFRLEQVEGQIESLYSYVRYVNLSFAIDSDVQAALLAAVDSETVDVEMNSLKKKLYDSKFASEVQTITYIFGSGGQAFNNDYERLLDFDPAETMHSALQEEASGFVMMMEEMRSVGHRKLIMARHIEDEARNVLGMVITAANIKHVENAFQANFGSTESNVYLVMNGAILASSHPLISRVDREREILMSLHQDNGLEATVKFQNEIFYPVARSSPHYGFVLLALIPQAAVKRATLYIGLIMVLVCIGIAAFSVIAAVLMSKSVSGPINKLSVSMSNTVEGRIEPAFTPLYNDEIGVLAKAFNDMATNINNYIVRIGEIEREKRIAEYEVLVSQINPHFLYNTMTSIIWLINYDKKEEAMAMTNALAILFRTSINSGQEIMTVEREVQYCEHYLSIQKLRYSDKFTYSIDIEEDVRKLLIIKLVLQPLVENALYHGVKADGGHIGIRAGRTGDCLCIDVSDSGGMMSAEKCAEINEMLRNGSTKGWSGIGIRNVSERLKLYYGKEYGLSYSIEDELTVARIRIPIRTEELGV